MPVRIGTGRTWRDAGQAAGDDLLTVRDAGSGRVLSVSTIALIHVQRRACTQPDENALTKTSQRISKLARPRRRRISKLVPSRRGARDGCDCATAAPSERGFVLVAVLWILLALSTLAGIFSVYFSARRCLGAQRQALQTEALVSASLELTAYQSPAEEKARPARGSFHFRLDDAHVSVTFSSRPRGSISTMRRRRCWRLCSPCSGATRAPQGLRRPDHRLAYASDAGQRRRRGFALRAAGLNYGPRQSCSRMSTSLRWWWVCRRPWSSARCHS